MIAPELLAVIEAARDRAAARMQLVGGDFFKDALPRCDAHILMSVVHDWDDERSIAILKNVRRAVAADGKLLLIEITLPETPRRGYVAYMDVGMLYFTGGRERKRSEYEPLLAASGWRLARVGTPVAELRPIPPRRFAPCAAISDAQDRAPRVDAGRFREELDSVIDQSLDG